MLICFLPPNIDNTILDVVMLLSMVDSELLSLSKHVGSFRSINEQSQHFLSMSDGRPTNDKIYISPFRDFLNRRAGNHPTPEHQYPFLPSAPGGRRPICSTCLNWSTSVQPLYACLLFMPFVHSWLQPLMLPPQLCTGRDCRPLERRRELASFAITTLPFIACAVLVHVLDEGTEIRVKLLREVFRRV